MDADVQLYLDALYRQYGNDWPQEALERLLQLTARYGCGGSWSEDATERAEQEERLALHRWAREMILAEKQRATLAAHIVRLCDCLTEAVTFAQTISPGTGHNAGLWAAAVSEAREDCESFPPLIGAVVTEGVLRG